MLKESYAELSKVKEEIAELNSRKSGIVKELNTQLLEADAKAKAIIESAKDQAKSIKADSERIKKEVEKHVFDIRLEADNYIIHARKIKTETDNAVNELERDKTDFAAKKLAMENEVRIIRNESSSIMSTANERLKGLNDKELQLTALEATLNRRELKNGEDLKVLIMGQDAIDSREKKLVEREQVLIKEMDAVKAISQANDDSLKAIDERNKRYDILVQDTKQAIEECNRIRKEQAEQKLSINAQFAILEKTNKEVEEKKKSNEETLELIALKNKEVEEKIAKLQELRKNK